MEMYPHLRVIISSETVSNFLSWSHRHCTAYTHNMILEHALIWEKYLNDAVCFQSLAGHIFPVNLSFSWKDWTIVLFRKYPIIQTVSKSFSFRKV